MYADDIVLMSETIEGLRNKFIKWWVAFVSMGLKVNLGITKVMVSGSITKNGLSKSRIDQCVVCSMRVKANFVLCVQFCKWIHGRCAGVRAPKFSRNFTCRISEGNIGEEVEQEERLCDEV